MTLKGTRRCLAISALAFAALTVVGCSTTAGNRNFAPDPGDKDYGKAMLYVDNPFLGKNRVYAYPDPIVISKYGQKPDQKITWYFIHKSTQIVFEDKRIGDHVDCTGGTADTYVCTLTLPIDLLAQGQDKLKLKYTIKGADHSGSLHDHDPEVEIDR